jgi:hypothetical protein
MLEVAVTTFRKHYADYLGKVRKGEDIGLPCAVKSLLDSYRLWMNVNMRRNNWQRFVQPVASMM